MAKKARVPIVKDTSPIVSQSRLQDTLLSLVSGLGGAKDKIVNMTYQLPELSKVDVENAYRGDWIARKAVDIPAEDSTRAWRSWQAENPQIETLEREEARLDIQSKVETALMFGRLYGGGAIILGVGDGGQELPLEIEKVGRNQLQFIHAVSRWSLSTGPMIENLMDPYFGEPQYYERRTDTGIVRFHPSRVIRFIGARRPDQLELGLIWGDSMLQVINDAIVSCAATTAGVANLVQEAKVDVIKIPQLSANLATQKYSNLLINRMTMANQIKSLVNALILDKEEEWARISVNFSALPDIMRLYLLIVSGAADVPATRFLGQSPTGLNSTGDSDIRNYYDSIQSKQNTKLRPVLARLDEVLMRSALGTRDPSINYTWNTLWQMDEKEKAEIFHKKAMVFEIDVRSAILSPEALRQGRQNQLIEDGVYPGIEIAFEEEANSELEVEETKVPKDKDEEEDNNNKTTDAKERSLYVYRKVKNAAEIIRWAKAQGFARILPAKELHVTIAYSRESVDWIKMGSDYSDTKGEMVIPPGGPRVVEPLGPSSVIVLMFANTALSWRHEDMRRAGASWDFDDYQPHITIALDKGGVDLSKVVPFRGKIVLGPEVFEEIKEDYYATIDT